MTRTAHTRWRRIFNRAWRRWRLNSVFRPLREKAVIWELLERGDRQARIWTLAWGKR